MKKSLVLFVVLTLMVAGFSLATSAARPYEGTTLRVLVWRDTLTKAVKGKVHEFEEKTGMDVVIDDLPTSSLSEKVALDLTSGAGKYDLVALDEPFVPRFAHYLLPYDEWPEGQVYQKTPLVDLADAAVKGGSWQGKVYGIPVNANIYMFIYRKDLINDPKNKEEFKKEYGYELRAPETTEELLDVAKFFFDPPRLYGWAPFTVKSEGETVEAMWLFNTFGTKVLNNELEVVLDKKRAVEAIKFYKNLMKTSPPGKMSFGHPETIQNVNMGKVAMTLQWPAIIAGHEDPEESLVAGKLGYKTGPEGPYGQRSAITGTWILGMATTCENKEAAAEFGYWWTSKEAGRDLIEAGMSPVRKDLLSDPELQKDHPWYAGQLENFKIGDNRPRYTHYSEVSDVIQTYFAQAITENMTPEAAIEKMIEEIEAVIEANK